jgi:hypothetical protein
MIAPAERLEPPHVKRDVVVHNEERPGATVPRVADVRQDPLEGVGVEVASAHLDNRAEAAVECAAARGFDHVDLPAEERVAAKYPHVAPRRPDLAVLKAAHAPRGVVAESVGASVGQARNLVVSAPCLEPTQQLTERDLPLAPHDEVDSAIRVLGIGLGSEARVVAAYDDARAGALLADEIDDPPGRLALEGHDRESDDVGLVFGHEPLDGLSDPVLN